MRGLNDHLDMIFHPPSQFSLFALSSLFFYSFGIPGMFAVDGNLDFPLFLCKQFEEFNYQSFADFMQSKWAAV